MPQNAYAPMISTGLVSTPNRIAATPSMAKETTIESRRLTVSATTPVGTSNTKMASSMAVPQRTSCSGLMPTSVT